MLIGWSALVVLAALLLVLGERSGRAEAARARKSSAKAPSTTAASSPQSSNGASASAATEPERKKRPLIGKPTTDEVAAIKAEGKKIAIIETAHGKFTFELYDDDAPLTVANFVKLARAGFYDGLTFHRVVKEPQPFVVQGGDPLGNGMGNPGYMIDGEFSPTRQHLEGTVAMARSRDPNSAGCQFFICLAPAPELDGQYAIFGQVITGMDVVHSLMQGDAMSRVTIERAGEP
jgi:cyclophilin family peptidyl-prolyl cis-trans isomerase